MRRMFLGFVALVAGVMMFAGSSFAGTNTGTMYVFTNVILTCFVSSSNMAFGDYAAVQVNTTATLFVSCNSPETGYNVDGDAGLHFDGSWRRVDNGGGSSIRYGLWKDGDGEFGDNDFANTFVFGSSQAGFTDGAGQGSHVINGSLFGGFMVPPGLYDDVVTLTVHF